MISNSKNTHQRNSMDNKKLEVKEEQLETISGADKANIKCPHCGSYNIVPFHSPSKGTAYLCGDCYRSFTIRSNKKKD